MAIFGGKVSDLMGNMKLEKEINDLKAKKQSLVRSVQNEINSIQAKITNEFVLIGSSAYDSHMNGENSLEPFNERFSEVTSLKGIIAEKEAKIEELSKRYDEEITLLNNLNPASASNNSAPSAAGNCSSCGAPRGAEDVFCKGCGTKLV